MQLDQFSSLTEVAIFFNFGYIALKEVREIVLRECKKKVKQVEECKSKIDQVSMILMTNSPDDALNQSEVEKIHNLSDSFEEQFNSVLDELSKVEKESAKHTNKTELVSKFFGCTLLVFLFFISLVDVETTPIWWMICGAAFLAISILHIPFQILKSDGSLKEYKGRIDGACNTLQSMFESNTDFLNTIISSYRTRRQKIGILRELDHTGEELKKTKN